MISGRRPAVTGAEFPAVSDLVSHRGEMVLLDRLLEHDGQSTTARVAVGDQRWLRSVDRTIPAWLALEYMAQCVSAHEGMLARAEGRPLPRGLLIGVSGLRFHRPSFPAESVLRVHASRVGGRPGLGVLSHACRVHADSAGREGDLLVEGRLTVAVAWPCDVATADSPS